MTASTLPTDEPVGQQLASLNSLSRAWDQADLFVDPDLTPAALRARREDAYAQAKKVAESQIQQSAAMAQEAADRAVQAAKVHMLDPEKADATRTGQAWEQVIKPRIADLPKLADWNRIVADAGPDELAAILRFGVPFIHRAYSSPAGTVSPEGRSRAADVVDMVQRRHISSSAKGAAALAAADRAAVEASTTALIARGLVYTRDQSGISRLGITAKRSGRK